jgi:hypothetical protein
MAHHLHTHRCHNDHHHARAHAHVRFEQSDLRPIHFSQIKPIHFSQIEKVVFSETVSSPASARYLS